jgi:hypothetical protein
MDQLPSKSYENAREKIQIAASKNRLRLTLANRGLTSLPPEIGQVRDLKELTHITVSRFYARISADVEK